MKVHCCVAAYISDYAFLGTALLPHRQHRVTFMVSLDHAMWFHAPFRADHWMLYECESPWTGESLPSSLGAEPGPARHGAGGHSVTVPPCRRVPGAGAGPAVAQGRSAGGHLRAGRSHPGGANTKTEQALAEEPRGLGPGRAEGGNTAPRRTWAGRECWCQRPPVTTGTRGGTRCDRAPTTAWNCVLPPAAPLLPAIKPLVSSWTQPLEFVPLAPPLPLPEGGHWDASAPQQPGCQEGKVLLRHTGLLPFLTSALLVTPRSCQSLLLLGLSLLPGSGSQGKGWASSQPSAGAGGFLLTGEVKLRRHSSRLALLPTKPLLSKVLFNV